MPHHLPPHHPRFDLLPAHAATLTDPIQRYGLGPPCHPVGGTEGQTGWGQSASDPIEHWLLEEEVGVVGVQS